MLYVIVGAVVVLSQLRQAFGMPVWPKVTPVEFPLLLRILLPVLAFVVAAKSTGRERGAALALCGTTALLLNWRDWALGPGAPVVLFLGAGMIWAGWTGSRRKKTEGRGDSYSNGNEA